MTNSELINNHIEKLRREITTSSNQNFRDEHLFGGVCLKNEFYDGKSWSYDDWSDTFTDAGNDGGIDWITASPSDDNVIKLVQCKFISSSPSSTDIKSDVSKLIDGYNRLKNNDNTLNQKVKEVFDNQINLVVENYNTEFHLFYSCQISETIISQAENLINELHSSNKVIVHTSNDIENKILMNLDESPYVEEDKITFFKEHGFVKNNKGIVLNISAKSLRNLFKSKKSKGLFAQNLRKFIKKQSVDNSIDHTLTHDRKSFWEKNNGIIITCSDYATDGDKLRLYKFSIVNGCQTTNRIGRREGTDEEFEDFAIVCKVIPCGEDEERVDNIAEASNKQKAINPEDLKSNSAEQKKLRNTLWSLHPPVSVQIKKGEPHLRSVEIKITNKDLGKLILSCYLQKPGTARSATSKIFGDESTYISIFKREYNAINYSDLIKLDKIYKEYCKKGKAQEWKGQSFFPMLSDDRRLPIQGLSTHAKYMILAFSILLIKIKRDNSFNPSNDWDNDINLQGPIFKNTRSDNYELKLYKLWNKILLSISEIYSQKYSLGETTGTSNFCKSDITYREVIFPKVYEDTYNSMTFKDELDMIMDDVFDLNI